MEIQVLVNDVQIGCFTLQVTPKKNVIYLFFWKKKRMNVAHVTARSTLMCFQLGEVIQLIITHTNPLSTYLRKLL